MDDLIRRLLERIVSGMKIALILTIYFSLCVLIILFFVGARP